MIIFSRLGVSSTSWLWERFPEGLSHSPNSVLVTHSYSLPEGHEEFIPGYRTFCAALLNQEKYRQLSHRFQLVFQFHLEQSFIISILILLLPMLL